MHVIVVLCVTGTVVIFGIVFSFGIRKVAGKSNQVTQWFLQNISLDIGFLSHLSVKYGDYDNVIEQYEYYADHIKVMINDLCTICIPHSDLIKQLPRLYEESLQMNADLAPYPEEKEKVVEMTVGNVVEFAEFCENRGMEFIYIQMPSELRCYMEKDMESRYTGNLTLEDIKHANELVESLVNQGIKVINLNEYQNLIENLEFDVSGHWSAVNALEATNIIKKKLEEYGILQDRNADEKYYYDVLSSHTFDELGYSYKLPVPLSEDTYDVVIDEKKRSSGSFEDVFIIDAMTWGNKGNVGIAYHNLFVQNNSNLMQVVRNDGKEGIKLLMLGDSFSWPLSAYVSQYVGRIDSFHPKFFCGNVRKYVLRNEPDVVIMAFFEGQINEDAAYENYIKLR